MNDQLALRRRIATLRTQQAQRLAAEAERRDRVDALIAEKDREIANLEAQVTIGAVS